MRLRVFSISIVCLAVLLAAPLPAQEHDHGHDHMGILFVKQQDGVQKKMVDLAEAIPADKYDWRPAPGVMSVAEVLMHIASGNYTMPRNFGAEPPAGFDRKALAETKEKAAVVAALKQSFAHSRQAVSAIPHAEIHKKIKFYGRDGEVGEFLMLMANHQHEHLGQLIAYARMNGITPPWSK